MKKFVLLLVMLCVLLLPAAVLGEQNGAPVYGLYQQTEEGRELVGTAVLMINNNLLLTTGGIRVSPDSLVAVGGDGEFQVLDGGETANGLLAMLILDGESAQQPLLFSNHDALLCFGLHADGTGAEPTPANFQQERYFGYDACEVTLEADVMPGAVLCDRYGVTGMVMSRRMEGVDRYVVLNAESIMSILQDELFGDMNNAPEAVVESGTNWITDQIGIEQKGCMIGLNWLGLDLSEGPDDCIWVVVTDHESNYFATYHINPDEGNADLPIQPGRTYTLWVSLGEERPDSLSEQEGEFVVVRTVSGGHFIAYDYMDQQFYLGISEGDELVDNEHAPRELPQPMTAADMDQVEHFWVQVSSTYALDEAVDMAGVICLITPSGESYVMPLAFTLAPEYMEKDTWAAPLDELMSEYLSIRGEWASGEYTMCYFYEDLLVNSMTFTLE